MQLEPFLTRHARYSPDRLAVVCSDARLTFRDFNCKVNQLANAMSDAGVGKSDNLACVLPNGLEILTLYWAAAKIGAVVVPLSPLLTAVGLAALIDHSDAVMIFVGPATVRDIDSVKTKLTKIAASGFVFAGPAQPGYVTFDDFVRKA